MYNLTISVAYTHRKHPGKFNTIASMVCMFMCKNNIRIQFICRVIYRSYETVLNRSLGVDHGAQCITRV